MFNTGLNILLSVAELGGYQHGGADGTAGVAGDEGVHRESGGQSGGRHAAVLLPLRGRECTQGNTHHRVLLQGFEFLKQVILREKIFVNGNGQKLKKEERTSVMYRLTRCIQWNY